MITIRKERAGDAEAILQVNEEAFGRPGYYPCFGFQPAHLFGIRCEFDVPEEAFMAMALHEGALAGCGGVVRYLPEFRDV